MKILDFLKKKKEEGDKEKTPAFSRPSGPGKENNTTKVVEDNAVFEIPDFSEEDLDFEVKPEEVKESDDSLEVKPFSEEMPKQETPPVEQEEHLEDPLKGLGEEPVEKKVEEEPQEEETLNVEDPSIEESQEPLEIGVEEGVESEEETLNVEDSQDVKEVSSESEEYALPSFEDIFLPKEKFQDVLREKKEAAKAFYHSKKEFEEFESTIKKDDKLVEEFKEKLMSIQELSLEIDQKLFG